MPLLPIITGLLGTDPKKRLAHIAEIGAGLLCLVGIGVAVWGTYRAFQGALSREFERGQLVCREASAQATVLAVAEGASQAANKTAAQIAKAASEGAAHERERVRIVNHYIKLEEEARNAPPDPVDSCVLPADRLRIWTAANRGPHPAPAGAEGAAAGQPDQAASAAAHAGVGAHEGSGGGSP